jgi:hypothetical protein
MLIINRHLFKYFKLVLYILFYMFIIIHIVECLGINILGGANEVHGGISYKRLDLNHIIYPTYFLIDFGVRNYFVYGYLCFVKCKEI